MSVPYLFYDDRCHIPCVCLLSPRSNPEKPFNPQKMNVPPSDKRSEIAVCETPRREYASRPAPAADTKVRVLVKPARRMWDRDITDFRLSNYARERLQNCGIVKVQDLYATNPKNEPGWYAVRELFGEIAKEV